MNSQHVCRKRPLEKLDSSTRVKKSSCSIYINTKSSFSSQLSKAQKAVDSGNSTIFLHATGGSITRAVQIALQINEDNFEAFDLWPYTSTTTVADDLMAVHDDANSETRERINPSLHVELKLKTQ